MASTKLAPAFALVRTLLQEQPRTFQSLLGAGLAQTSSAGGAMSTGETSSSSASASAPVAAVRKGKARETTSSAAKQARVPEGHPFVSSTFLKNRILPVLESQHLIHLAPSKPTSGSGQTFKWALGPPPSAASRGARAAAPTESMPTWDTEAHWARLLEGAHPGQTAREYSVHRAMEKSLRRDQAVLDGKVRLDERGMRGWAAREPGLTTTGERGHLNVRRERARGRKERERIALGAAP